MTTPEQREQIYAGMKNPAEAADLRILHIQQDEEREHFSDRCRGILDMKEDELKHSGHKSIEAALVYTAKEHVKRLHKMIKEHIKKYPD